MAVYHAVEGLGAVGDEGGVGVEGFAFDDEGEGFRGEDAMGMVSGDVVHGRKLIPVVSDWGRH